MNDVFLSWSYCNALTWQLGLPSRLHGPLQRHKKLNNSKSCEFHKHNCSLLVNKITSVVVADADRVELLFNFRMNNEKGFRLQAPKVCFGFIFAISCRRF